MFNSIKLFKKNKFYWKGEVEPANLHKNSRSASWLELFIDLVFVASLGGIVHGLVDNFSIFGFVETIFYFLIIWSFWNSLTIYSHLFEQPGVVHRGIVFLNMFVFVLTLIPYSNDYSLYILDPKVPFSFALTIVISRFVMYLTWKNAYNKTYNKHFKEYLKARYQMYIVSIILVTIGLLSLTINTIIIQPLMFMSVANEFCFNLLYKKGKLNKNVQKYFNQEHLVERFGLFTMLIIGESILAIVSNIQAPVLTLENIVMLFLWLTIVFLLWWLYYEFSMKKRIDNLNYWRYAHVLVHFSFILIAIAINLSLHGTHYMYLKLIPISLILYFISLIVLRRTLNVKVSIESEAHLDETDLYKKMFISNIISILLLLAVLIIGPSLIITLISISIILIFNLVVYYYNFIKLMNDILW